MVTKFATYAHQLPSSPNRRLSKNALSSSTNTILAILDQALKKLVKKARKKHKRKGKTSFIIIDAQSVKNVMVDGGYQDEPFANSVKTLLGETVTTEVAKRDELHTFKVIPKRWVVERSFAWLEKNRRLWKNCERLLNSSLQLTNLAFIALLLKRL